MKIKCAIWIAGIGTILASALRCVQMLCFFDYETGFATDSGMMTGLYSGVTLLTTLASGLLCRFDRSLSGRMRPASNGAVSASLLFMAMFLALCTVVPFRDFYTQRNFGVAYFIPAAHVNAHLLLAVLSAVFGIASLVSAVLWMRGKAFPGRSGVLGAAGVVWGLYYMVLTFMVYSASATTQENLFTVGGGAAMLVFLLAEGKLISGVGGKNTVRRLYAFGLPAAVLWMTYVSSNTVLIIAGRGYATEMPYAIQLVMLMLSVHICALLLTFRKVNFEPEQTAGGTSDVF